MCIFLAFTRRLPLTATMASSSADDPRFDIVGGLLSRNLGEIVLLKKIIASFLYSGDLVNMALTSKAWNEGVKTAVKGSEAGRRLMTKMLDSQLARGALLRAQDRPPARQPPTLQPPTLCG